MRKLLSLLICVAMVMSLGISASAFTTVKVTSIKLDKSNISLNQGQTYRLKATLTPSNTAKVLLKYSTGNNKIATVSAKGAILGVGEGKTTIMWWDTKFFSRLVVFSHPRLQVACIVTKI